MKVCAIIFSLFLILAGSQAAYSSIKQLADATVPCKGKNGFATYDQHALGLAGSTYKVFTYSFWVQMPSSTALAQLPLFQNYVVAIFNKHPDAAFNMQAFYNESPKGVTSFDAVTTPYIWLFFSQTIDYTTNTVMNYFYNPKQATSSTSHGVIYQFHSFPAGTADTILDNERLYLGGATDAPKSCGTFQRIFVSGANSPLHIPSYDVLIFGYKEIEYIGLFQMNELQGQRANNPLDSSLYFTFGSDPLNADSNDPVWDLANGGLLFESDASFTKYITLDGLLSLDANGWLDFTFEWEMLIQNASTSGYPRYPMQFLQKGPFTITFEQDNRMSIGIGSVTQTFSGVGSVPGNTFNRFKLYCNNFERPTISCRYWLNHTHQGELVFPSSVSFVDSPTYALMIPPTNAGEKAFRGTLKQFLIVRNHSTFYPEAASEGCLWSWGPSCYTINPSYTPQLECSPGTYLDPVSNVCASCQTGCHTCENGTACTTCSSDFDLNNGICACSGGTYFDSLIGNCSDKCIAHCDTCSNNTPGATCLTCESEYYYVAAQNLCTETCPLGNYANDMAGTCEFENCSSSCSTCPNCVACESEYVCSQCKTGMYSENGVCVTKCTSHIISFNGQCLNSCPEGYAFQNQGAFNSCVPCSSSCATCSNTSADICLSCNLGSFLSNGNCLPCSPQCKMCECNANNCTTPCPAGEYVLGSTCVSSCPSSYYLIHENQTCVPCSRPMALTPTNTCVFCEGNCLLCSDSLKCLECEPGLELTSSGYCSLPGKESNLKVNTGSIASVTTLDLMKYSTLQTILVELSSDIKSSSDIQVYWLLFAKSIASDYLSLSCDHIKTLATDADRDFPSSVVQTGTSGFDFSDFTNSNAIYLPFKGLRAGLDYNYTICSKPALYDRWETASIEFATKDNGNYIQRVTLEIDNELPNELLTDFLCSITTTLEIPNSRILGPQGEMCDNPDERRRRVLEDFNLKKPKSSRFLQSSQQRNQLDLLIYGDPYLEMLDLSTAHITSLVTSQDFIQSFTYTPASSGVPLKITKANIGQIVFTASPILETQSLTYEIKGTSLFLPNITLKKTDGTLYIYLAPSSYGLSGDALPSSQKILSLFGSNAQSASQDIIVKRIKFYDGEPVSVIIDGIKPNTTYNVAIFGTNEDASPFSFRTPRMIFEATTGLVFPKQNFGFSVFIFIATEATALVLLILTCFWMFSSCSNGKIICWLRKKKAKYAAKIPDLPAKLRVKDDSEKKFIKVVSKTSSNLTIFDLNGETQSRDLISSRAHLSLDKSASISSPKKGDGNTSELSDTPRLPLGLSSIDSKSTIQVLERIDLSELEEPPHRVFGYDGRITITRRRGSPYHRGHTGL